MVGAIKIHPTDKGEFGKGLERQFWGHLLFLHTFWGAQYV